MRNRYPGNEIIERVRVARTMCIEANKEPISVTEYVTRTDKWRYYAAYLEWNYGPAIANDVLHNLWDDAYHAMQRGR